MKTRIYQTNVGSTLRSDPSGTVQIVLGGSGSWGMADVDWGINSQCTEHMIQEGHHAFDVRHWVMEYQVLADVDHTYTLYNVMSNGQDSAVASYRARGGNASLYPWFGVPATPVRPITDGAFYVPTLDLDPLQRDAYHNCLVKNEALWAASMLEIGSSLRILPTFLSGVRTALVGAGRVASRYSIKAAIAGFKTAGRVAVRLHQMETKGQSLMSMSRIFTQGMRDLTGSNTPRAFQRRLLKAVKGALREGSLIWANNQLAFSFGVRPLIGDTIKLVDRWNRKTRLGTKVRGSAVLNAELHVVYDRLDPRISPPPTLAAKQTEWQEGYKGNSWLHFSHDRFPLKVIAYYNGHMERPPVKVGPLIDRYLASGPATLANEMIPFSFVWGWFVDTRAVLDELDLKLKSFRFTLGEGSVSYKSKGAFSLVRHSCWTGPSQVWRTTFDGKNLYSQAFSYYERASAPPPSGVGVANGFGKNQSILSVALALQRLL